MLIFNNAATAAGGFMNLKQGDIVTCSFGCEDIKAYIVDVSEYIVIAPMNSEGETQERTVSIRREDIKTVSFQEKNRYEMKHEPKPHVRFEVKPFNNSTEKDFDYV